MNTLRRRIGITALLLAMGACAGSQEGEPATPSANIRVVNPFVPTTALTVYVLQGGGDRDELGTVVPSGERTFRFHPEAMDFEGFRLVAETGSGREITSPPFALRTDQTVVWDVQANTVQPR